MARIPERLGYPTHKEWFNAIAENREQNNLLVREGYIKLFNTILSLPNLEEQSKKFWRDYQEEDIEFVGIGFEDLNSLSPNDKVLLVHVPDILGFGLPLKFGVFDVMDDKRESHKGIHYHSAKLIVETLHGGMLRPRSVLSFEYEHSEKASDWYKKGVDYELFGSSERQQKIKQATELDLLIAANSLAQLYSKRIQLQKVQPTT